MVQQSAELDVLSKQYRNALDKINVEWSSIEKMQDAAQKDASTQELLARVKNELSQAAKTDADRQNQKILTSALEKMYNAETTLKGEQAKTEGAKREELGASAGLKSAQTDTENALRDVRKAKTAEEIFAMSEKTKSIRRVDAREAIDQLANLYGIDTKSMSPLDVITKTAAFIRTRGGGKEGERRLSELNRLAKIAYDFEVN